MKPNATLWGAFFLIASFAVHAGDVYKCNVSGTPVYQDRPCAGGSKVKMRDSASSAQTASRADSLGTLYRKVQAASAAERQLRKGMEHDIASTKARLGPKVNAPPPTPKPSGSRVSGCQRSGPLTMTSMR